MEKLLKWNLCQRVLSATFLHVINKFFVSLFMLFVASAFSQMKMEQKKVSARPSKNGKLLFVAIKHEVENFYALSW